MASNGGSSKILRATINVTTGSSLKNLNKLYQSLNRVNRALHEINGTSVRIGVGVASVTRETNQLANSADRAANNFRRASGTISQLVQKLRHIYVLYMGFRSVEALFNVSDQITGAENKLNYYYAKQNGGDYTAASQMTDETMSKIYNVAQGARTGYLDMLGNVSKSMILSGDAFKNNIDNAIRFQEVMAKAYTISGASEAEQATSMYQLIQALGANTLQGDELRSVREGAQLAYQAIEKFAQELYNTDLSLKDLASQGKITSDVVVAGVMAASEEIDEAFKHTKMTFGQAAVLIKNFTVEAFRPLSERLTEILNSERGQAFLKGITNAIQILVNVLQVLLTIIENIVNFVITYYKPIVTALEIIGAALSMYLISKIILLRKEVAALLAEMIAKAAIAAVEWMVAFWPLTIILGILILIIVAVNLVSDSFADACGNIVGAVWMAIQFIINMVKLVLFAVLVVILTIVYAVANLGISIANIAKGIWAVIEALAYNIKTAFKNSFYEAAARAWDFAASACNAMLKVASVINSILGVFGIQLDVSGLMAGLKIAQRNAAGIKSAKDAYKDIGTVFSENKGTIATYNIGGELDNLYNGMGIFQEGWDEDAFNTGYNAGSSFGQSIENAFAGLGNNAAVDNALNVNDFSDVLDNIDGNTGKTAGNTGKSAKLAEEDLKYLRKIAEREWKKEFTTATIKVDMTNNNNINGESDLDGIVTKLTDKLYEELNTVAAGVYV